MTSERERKPARAARTFLAVLLAASVGAAARAGAAQQPPAGAAPGDAAGDGWRRHASPPELAFPADHGSHPAFRTEWWYATGIVADAEGARFGFQLTVFRHGLDARPPAEGASRLRAREAYAAHLAVCDLGAGRLAFAERLRRGDGMLAHADVGGLRAFVEGFEIALAPHGALRLSASDRERAIGLDLELAPEKPLVPHGERGLSRKGAQPGNASAYVSWTRLAARGTLTAGGRERAVEGGAWFDHEWGTSQLGEGVVGWDWLGLRLADGRDLMVYRLRRADGSADALSAATLVERDGSTRAASGAEIELSVRERWKSPRSGAEYPARVALRIPSLGIDLEARAQVADCELDARASTGAVYWEGPVEVGGGARGEGYLELAGYAGSLERRL